jgi:tight adherence protein B
MVAREAPPPIGDEFKMMMQEMAVGITPEDSLRNLARRIRSSDVDLMVTAVIIQKRVGGALSQILDTIANVIRDRVRLRGQVRTLTAQGRLTGTLLALMPILLGLAINALTRDGSGGSYFTPMFDTRPYKLANGSEGGFGPAGTYMLVTAVIMQLAGFLSIRKITTIEV